MWRYGSVWKCVLTWWSGYVWTAICTMPSRRTPAACFSGAVIEWIRSWIFEAPALVIGSDNCRQPDDIHSSQTRIPHSTLTRVCAWPLIYFRDVQLYQCLDYWNCYFNNLRPLIEPRFATVTGQKYSSNFSARQYNTFI